MWPPGPSRGCCIFRRFPPYFPPSPSPVQAFHSSGAFIPPGRPHTSTGNGTFSPQIPISTPIGLFLKRRPIWTDQHPHFPKQRPIWPSFNPGEGSGSPVPHRSSHADDSRPAIESRAKSNRCTWSERIDARIPAGPAVQGVGDGGDRGNRHPHDRHPGDDHSRINRHDPPGRGGMIPLSSGPRPRPPRSRRSQGRRRPRTR